MLVIGKQMSALRLQSGDTASLFSFVQILNYVPICILATEENFTEEGALGDNCSEYAPSAFRPRNIAYRKAHRDSKVLDARSFIVFGR